MRKWSIALLCCFALSACVSLKGVMTYPSSDEVFYAEIDQGIFDAEARVRLDNRKGVTCSGTSRVVYTPPIGCTGQRGRVLLNCNDGRTILAVWQAESCSSGNGVGKDSSGSRVVFFYGDEDESTLKSRAGIDGKTKPGGRERPVGSGTGFFITGNGLLVTNEHVVNGGKSFEIRYPKTGRRVKAKLLNSDSSNDVAFLKAEVDSVPIPLAPRFEAKRGDEVMTLGYPLPEVQGVQQKATFGRVNAFTGVRDDVRKFQIDVPIQPGNSGGPLINAHGEVIGLTTSGLSSDLAAVVNYAVKIDYLYPMLRGVDYTPVKRPSRKYSMVELTELYEDSVVQVINKQ
jgi:S1-C subfamily serine protease